MIPDIESIVESLFAGECTKEQAMRWIEMHMEAERKIHFKKGYDAGALNGYEA